MAAARTFVMYIRNYINSMDKLNMYKNINRQKGDMQMLGYVILFLVALFIVWVLTGGPKQKEADSPFIKTNINQTDQIQIQSPNPRPR